MPAIRSRQIWAQANAFTARAPLALAVPLGVFLAGFVYFLCRSRGYFSDEGSYCTIAQGILHGDLPYRSYFNEKPPLQYFWTAAIMAISAPTMSGARLASAAALMLTAACILCGPAALRRNGAALVGWTGLIFLAALDLGGFNDTAESSLGFLFAVSALLIAAPPPSDAGRLQWRGALQGAIFGIAIGFRQTAIAPALVMLFLPQAILPRRVFCCGLAVGLLCWLLPLMALGIGAEFFDSVIGFHVNNPSVGTYFRGPIENELAATGLWVTCLGWLATLKEYRAKRVWLIVWFAAMALAFFGRMDAFRLWPSTAAMLVLLARADLAAFSARAAALATACVALIALVLNRPMAFPESVDVSNDIAAMTAADDRVWTGPFNPLRYCLAQRRPASRYYFVLPWTAKPEVRREIVADIAASAKLIAIDHIESDSDSSLRRLLPELAGVIAKDYHFIGTRRGTYFYARNTAQASRN